MKVIYRATTHELENRDFSNVAELKAAYEAAGIAYEIGDEPSEGIDYEVIDLRTPFELKQEAKKIVTADFADYKAKNADADDLTIWKTLRQSYEDGEALAEMAEANPELTQELAEAMHTYALDHEESLESQMYAEQGRLDMVKIKYVDHWGKTRKIWAEDAIVAANNECTDDIWYEETTAADLKQLCEDNEDEVPAWLATIADETKLYRADHLVRPIDRDLENLYSLEPIDKLEAVKAWLVHDGGHIIELDD